MRIAIDILLPSPLILITITMPTLSPKASAKAIAKAIEGRTKGIAKMI